MNKVKTIIIGAGPAGLTAGKYLEDALILDKKKEIGKPVQCAEGISKESLIGQGIEPDPAWISTTINVIEIVAPSGRKASLKGNELGYILERPLFERFLASQCKAEIRLNSKVVDIKKQGTSWLVYAENGDVFEATYLIGADGPLSIVRTKLFQEKIEILPTFEYLVELEKEIPVSVMRMYFDKEKFPEGYIWVFPKSKNRANIGLGGKKELDKRFRYFMETIIKPEFGQYTLLENKSGTITWGGAKIKLFHDNVFLVGDAGALIDPILGGGMSNAMISGQLAAESILTDSTDLFEKRLKALPQFSSDLIVAQKILYSLPNPVLEEIIDVLRQKEISQLQTLSGFAAFLSKPQLRTRTFQLLRLFSILQKNGTSFG